MSVDIEQVEAVYLCAFTDGSWCRRILATDADSARKQFLASIGAVDTGQVVTVHPTQTEGVSNHVTP